MAKTKKSKPDEQQEKEETKPVFDPNINYLDPKWSQYVLSHFEDDELEGENPRLEGLRRVTGLVLGEVIEEGSELIASPCIDNQMKACSKAWIVIETKKDKKILRFEALADASQDNCTNEFSIYPVAMSDTRAKGRCYRAALKLKSVVSAEEIGVNDQSVEDPNRLISSGQIAAVRLLADQTNVSITKLLDDLEIPYAIDKDSNIAKLSSIKYEEAKIVSNRLNDLRSSGHIPEKLIRG